MQHVGILITIIYKLQQIFTVNLDNSDGLLKETKQDYYH